jgi:flagellar hook assembly protein FlgD/chitodextrinase
LGTSFVLKWDASTDDVGVDHYEIYRNGELLQDNHTQTSFIVSDLTMNTVYTMTVKAVDAAGTKSESSDELLVTTSDSSQLGPELTILSMDKVVNAALNVKYNLAADAFIVARILNAANKTVAVGTNNILTKAGNRNTAIATAKLADGKYYLQLTARDGTTNNRTILYRNVTVDKTKPVITAQSATAISAPGTSSTVSYTLSEKVYVTIGVYDSKNALIKTIVKDKLRNSGANTVTWNGRDKRNKLVDDGVYTVRIDARDYVNLTAVAKTTKVTIERATPVISDVSDSPDTFKATGTTLSTIKYTLSESAKVTIVVVDSAGATVRTLATAVTRPSGVNTITWNGRNTANGLVAAGTYTFKINANDLATTPKAATEQTGTITLMR